MPPSDEHTVDLGDDVAIGSGREGEPQARRVDFDVGCERAGLDQGAGSVRLASNRLGALAMSPQGVRRSDLGG